jgi:hypothetical protein
MKAITYTLLLTIIAACKSPMPVTGNPDDHTSTSGTAGSAKMTNELPKKSQNVVVKPDSSKIKMDTSKQKRQPD